MLLIGIILLVVILYLPSGLAGLMERWRKRALRGQHANP
jgi:ABC-type branched-subunit amino acid transport system permease subunit